MNYDFLVNGYRSILEIFTLQNNITLGQRISPNLQSSEGQNIICEVKSLEQALVKSVIILGVMDKERLHSPGNCFLVPCHSSVECYACNHIYNLRIPL